VTDPASAAAYVTPPSGDTRCRLQDAACSPVTGDAFYWPLSLLDTIGKQFEKILFNRILNEVNEHELVRDKYFGFDPGIAPPCS